MACGQTHTIAGAIAGISASLLDKGDAPSYAKNIATASVVGAIAGKLPDMIEPATNPNHRKFFHSIVFLVLAGKAVHWLYEWQPEEEWQKALRHIGLIAGAGYFSHLAFDFVTPKSLPVI